MILNEEGNRIFSVSSDGSLKVWRNDCKRTHYKFINECVDVCPKGFFPFRGNCIPKLFSIYPYVITFTLLGLLLIIIKIIRVSYMLKKNILYHPNIDNRQKEII